MSITKKNLNKRKKVTVRSLPTRSRRTNNKKAKQNNNNDNAAVVANLTKEDKGARNMIIDPIIERLLEMEHNDKINGRPLYGKIKETVDKYKYSLPWLNKEPLKNRVQHRRLKHKKSYNDMADLTTPTPSLTIHQHNHIPVIVMVCIRFKL